MRLVVSGASGFVGRRLVEALSSRGHEVAVVIRRLEQKWPGNVHVISAAEGCGRLVEDIAAFAPQRAVHLASLFLASHDPDQVDALIDTNLRFSTVFAEACARAGVVLFVNTGTAWQRFGGEAYRPVNLYAATKEAFEAILRYYGDAMGMRSITIRLGDTYGPDDTRNKLVGVLIHHIQSQKSLSMSPGDQRINLVHIDDVVRGFVLATESGSDTILPENVYALRGAETLTLRELVTRLEGLSGKRVPVLFGEKPYRNREVFEPETLTPNLPSWSPEVSLDAGLSDLMRRMGGAS